MKKSALMLLVLTSVCLVHAAGIGNLRKNADFPAELRSNTFKGISNLLKNADFSSGMAHWEFLGNIGSATPKDGAIVLNIKKGGDAGMLKLQQAVRCLKVGGTYRLDMTVDCEKPQTRPVVVSYRMRNKPKNLGVIKWIPLRQGEQKVFVEIVPGEDSDSPDDPPVLSLYMGDLDGKVTLSDIALYDLGAIEGGRPPFSDEWTIFALMDPAVEVVDEIPAELPGVKDRTVRPIAADYPSKDGENSINLRLETCARYRTFQDPAMLYNEFESDCDQLLPVGFGADWYMDLFLNGRKIYSTMQSGNAKKPIDSTNHLVFLPVRKGKNLLAVKVLAGSEGWKFCWGPAQPPTPPQVFTAKEGYYPIDTAKLAVKAGSALDLSALVDAPAGKYGRAVITQDGHIAFEHNPQPQRFFGFSGEPDEKVWKTAKDSDFPFLAAEYARAIRAQGYNLFRMHGFDEWVMTGAVEDQKPLPRYLDRWDRMVYEMKRQGIYLQLNLFAFGLYTSDKERYLTAEKRQTNKVLFLVGEPNLRARFAETSRKVLNHVNPYTKLAWKDDPAFVAVEYYNELGLGIEFAPAMERSYPEDFRYFKGKWRDFLAKKYAALPEGKNPHSPATMENPPLPVFWDKSQLRVDYDEFWYECMKETYRFCDQVMKDCGYSGLTLQCPMPALRCTAASWESVQIVDGHGYLCHPDGGEQPGASVGQTSAIEDAANVFRDSFGKHIYGRPYFYNEHNYCFRNPYQYEKAVSLDAYAALNDWDSLGIHSGAVALGSDRRASTFHAANNAVLRAGEFLSTLFFLRRDVAPARHNVAVALDKKYVFTVGNSAYALSPTQSRLTLLTKVSSLFTDLPRYDRVPQPATPDMTVAPVGGSEIVWHGWFATAKETAASDSSLEAVVNEMRERGILPEDNITDLAQQVYQSETGEITMYVKEKKMTVITPKSEAAALTAGSTVKLNTVEVKKSSVNSLVGLASVDNLPLAESRRMVLVLATRVANTNMQNDASGVYLRVVGIPPVLYQCGEFEVRIDRADKLRCYALSLTGERMEEVPLVRSGDGLTFALDTAKLKHGPTPFFEIAADNGEN